MARIMIFENKQTELEIVDVAVALQLTQFQLIFSKLVKEVHAIATASSTSTF